ncbi:hypothetical protein H0H93_014572, partial [Arthromyces matolae]
MRDSLTATSKDITSLRSFMNIMDKEIKSLKSGSAPTLHSAQVQLKQQQSGPLCYHCWQLGHRLNECEHVRRQLAEGKVGWFDNRLRLASGEAVPRDPPNISPKDRIDSLSDRNVAAFYGWVEENSTMTPTYSSYTNAVRDSRDDMLERISQGKQDQRSDSDKKLDRLCDLVTGLINTRTSANAEE